MIQLLEQNLRWGHGTTPHPWGPLGQWQTSRNLAGNPDSPQAVIFLASITDVMMGS